MGEQEMKVVDFKPDEAPRPPRRRGWLWAVGGLVVCAAVFLIFVRYINVLAGVAVAAAVLAAFSTWRLARWRRVQAAYYERPSQGVTLATYLLFLVAWFLGLLAIVPLILVSVAIAIIVVGSVFLLVIILLVTTLLRPR